MISMLLATGSGNRCELPVVSGKRGAPHPNCAALRLARKGDLGEFLVAAQAPPARVSQPVTGVFAVFDAADELRPYPAHRCGAGASAERRVERTFRCGEFVESCPQAAAGRHREPG